MKKKLSASSRHAQHQQVKATDITFTDKMAKELNSLKKHKINLNDPDAPEITAWDEVAIGKFYRPIKKQITIRIDTDVLDWLKNNTLKYQTLINQICRKYMKDHIKISK